MSVIDNLVTNRTAGSYYNYGDVNRVNEAIIYLAGLLTEAGYPVTLPDTLPTNWARTSHYYIEDADKVSKALTLVKNQFAALKAGSFPTTFDNLTFTGANEIEQFLFNCDRLLAALIEEKSMRQCGAYEQTGGAILL